MPVLKGLITGERSASASTNTAVERILNDAAATAQAAGANLNDEQLRQAAVSNLLVAGGQMTVPQIRDHVRNGETTPQITATVLVINGQRYVISEMDEDQFVMFQRKMGQRIAPVTFELPDDPARRRVEAARIRPVRAIANLINGD